MYEFLILAQLSRRPMHGYLIAQIIGHIIGPHRQVQWGALYPVLSRLLKEGLIRVDAEDDEGDVRSRKVYSLTETGTERLHEHLMDTEHHQGEYDVMFTHKVAFFHRLTPAERIQLASHYLVYAQRNVDHRQKKLRDVQEAETPLTAPQVADLIEVLNHSLAYWQHELAWARRLIEQNRLQEAM